MKLYLYLMIKKKQIINTHAINFKVKANGAFQNKNLSNSCNSKVLNIYLL